MNTQSLPEELDRLKFGYKKESFHDKPYTLHPILTKIGWRIRHIKHYWKTFINPPRD